MPNETGIEWTDFTSNPVTYRDKATGRTVWACVKHSSGCAHCYAETLAKRYGRGGPFLKSEMEKVEPFLDEKELRRLLADPKLKGERVFIGDMTDIFGEWVPDPLLDRLLAALAMRPDVTFQLLTKRADRMRSHIAGMDGREIDLDNLIPRVNRKPVDWPARNLWLGVSVENQDATWRIAELVKTPAAVRFLSCEPLLGPVDLSRVMTRFGNESMSHPIWNDVLRREYGDGATGERLARLRSGIDWVIVGGESGHGARPCQVEWIRSLVAQCRAASVPVFVKQLGSNATANYYDEFRDEWESNRGNEWPESLDWNHRDGQPPLTARVALPMAKKGGDMADWPEGLRVRQFPQPEGGRRARR